MANEKHIPVLLNEILSFIREGDVFVDCTVGFGGHAEKILEKFPKIRLIGIDQDKEALKSAKIKLDRFGDRIRLLKGNFRDIDELAEKEGIKKVKGILLDLGVSSYQLDKRERGFSFKKEGPLDMRMDQENELTAEKIINNYREEELIKIFYGYGEEKFAKRIAGKIVRQRKEKKIGLTSELKEIIIGVLPKSYLRKLKIDPATKVFQALRIEVNDELKSLEEFLDKSIDILQTGGVLEIISFHSLEDRIVKNFFRTESKECLCPKEVMVCNCGHKKSLKILTKKPIVPTEKEIGQNPRSRSAKLRVAEKI